MLLTQSSSSSVVVAVLWSGDVRPRPVRLRHVFGTLEVNCGGRAHCYERGADGDEAKHRHHHRLDGLWQRGTATFRRAEVFRCGRARWSGGLGGPLAALWRGGVQLQHVQLRRLRRRADNHLRRQRCSFDAVVGVLQPLFDGSANVEFKSSTAAELAGISDCNVKLLG